MSYEDYLVKRQNYAIIGCVAFFLMSFGYVLGNQAHGIAELMSKTPITAYAWYAVATASLALWLWACLRYAQIRRDWARQERSQTQQLLESVRGGSK